MLYYGSEIDPHLLRDVVRGIMEDRKADAILDLKRLFDSSPYMVQIIDVEYRRKRT